MKQARSKFIGATGGPVAFEHSGAASTALTVPPPPPAVTDITGDINSSDLQIANLAIKHAIDTRFEEVPPGKFMLTSGGELLASIDPPVTVIPIAMRTGYLQKETEPGELPLRVWTKEAMIEAGGALEAGGPDMLLFGRFADITVLVAGLDRSPNVMLLSLGGKKWCPAIFSAKKSVYDTVAKAMLTQIKIQQLAGNPNARLLDFPWELGVKKVTGTFTFLAPTIKRLEAHSPAMVAELRDVAATL